MYENYKKIIDYNFQQYKPINEVINEPLNEPLNEAEDVSLKKNTIREVNLCDPSQMPYGKLSNNFSFNFNLDNDYWSSVTQYIYTNAIPNFSYRQTLKKKLGYLSDNKVNSYELYKEFLEKCNESIIAQALDEALKVKLENPEVYNILLNDTSPSGIEYISDDNFLGVGSNKNGFNLLGKYLVQIRDYNKNIVEKEKKDKELYNQMYKSYVLYSFLKQSILSGISDLSEYLYSNFNTEDWSPNALERIIDIYLRSEEGQIREKALNTALNDKSSENFFIELYKKQDPIVYPLFEYSIKNPNILIFDLRKKYLRKLKDSQEFYEKEKVFDLYFEYTIEKNYPLIPKNKYIKVRSQELSKISGEKFEQLKTDLYFNRKQLPSILYEKIQDALKKIKVPTNDEVNFAEQFNIQDLEELKTNIEEEKEIPETEIKPTLIYPNNTNNFIDYFDPNTSFLSNKSVQVLSPFVFTGSLKINNIIYPTVMHYILVRLLSTLPSIGSMEKAYSFIFRSAKIDKNYISLTDFSSYDNAKISYILEKEKNDSELLKILAVKAIDNKFKSYELQSLLLSTNDMNLVYDCEDPILGTGINRNGENFVGLYLEKLRSTIFYNQIEDKNIIIDIDNLWDIIEADNFINDWMEMRVKDIITTAKKVRNFLKLKYNLKIDINYSFISYIIDTIYYPYKEIKKYTNIIDTPVYFYNIVFKYIKVNTPLISKILWEKIAGSLYYLINLRYDIGVSLDMISLRNIILKIEKWLSTDKLCIEIIKSNNKKSCIVSALLNILQSIIDFNQKVSSLQEEEFYVEQDVIKRILPRELNSILTELDVRLATSILLNSKFISETGFDIQEELIEDQDIIDEDQSIDEEENEFDYEEESEPEDGAGDNNTENIMSYIRENKLFSDGLYISDYNSISFKINKAVELVDSYKMSDTVKTNRINFFARIKN